MEANGAPVKIYLDPVEMAETESVVLSIVPDFRVENNDIEYTRTDAFIDKAAEWLRCNLCNFFDSTREESDKFIYNFKNAMKL